MLELQKLNVDYKHRSWFGPPAHSDTPTYHALKHKLNQATAATPPKREGINGCSSRLYVPPQPMERYKERLARCGIEFKSRFMGLPAHCESRPPGMVEVRYMTAEAEKARQLPPPTTP